LARISTKNYNPAAIIRESSSVIDEAVIYTEISVSLTRAGLDVDL
jgi:hypothetical protein